MNKIKYHKVKVNSYSWVQLLYLIYFVLLSSCIILFITTKNIFVLLGVVAMVLIGVMFTATIRPQVVKVRNISRLIHNHIEENSLCHSEYIHNKKRYIFYPETYWRLDEAINTLFIRFRLSGNKINLRGLEQGLADRLEKICINIFEERGFVEYLFEWEKEKQLVIHSKKEIQGEYGDTQIPLSKSLIWDYKKVAHFIIAGTTGSGKTTYARFLISSLTNRGVRVIYLDINRDSEMESFCNKNSITYVYEPEDIIKAIKETADELKSRTKDIAQIGIKEDFDFSFNPVYLICDEIILLKLMLPKKSYDELIVHINAIIAAGRSKAVFCGLITQSALAEYFGNSGIRGNIRLKVALGQMTVTELGMIFGNDFSDMKNLRYSEVGSGLIMRNGIDSRPREYVAPYITSDLLN